MWSMIKEWFNRNKAYLAMIFLSSLAIGTGIAVLSALYPVVLSAFAGLMFLGATPLAFLTSLSAPLAAFTLGLIVAAMSSVLIAASLASMQQLISISSHVCALFITENEQDALPQLDASYDFLKKHLHSDACVSEQADEVDEDEFYELSISSSGDEGGFPPPNPELSGEPDAAFPSCSM